MSAGTGPLAALHAEWSAAIKAELDAATELRRVVHAHPDVSGAEEPTARTVAAALAMPMDRIAGTGRVGRVGPADGPSILLRAELDALPVTERTGAPYAATNAAMHACGHDVHLAALVAVVRAARGLDLPFGLVALLQPREETHPSGALDVLESGLLTRHEVAAAAGAHVHHLVPHGAVATGAGVINAASDEVDIVLRGVGGHGGYPHRACDPVAAVAHLVLALPELVRRTVSPMRPAMISVGHLEASSHSSNVLPSSARVLATVRTVDDTDRALLLDRVRQAAEHQAASFGLDPEVTVHAGEPVLRNDPDLVDRVDGWLERSGVTVGEPMRSLGADDFSYYSATVPAVMAFVGVRTPDGAATPSLHNDTFLPAEESIVDVAAALLSGYLGAAELLLARA